MTTATPARTPGTYDKHHAGVHKRDAQDWWVSLFRGAWLVILGAFAIGARSPMLLTMVFATAALVTGAAVLTDTLWMRARTRLYLTQSIGSLLVGFLVLVTPPGTAYELRVAPIALWAAAIDLAVLNRHRF